MFLHRITFMALKTLLLSVFILFLCFGTESNAQNRKVAVLNFSTFEEYLHQNSDTLYIINFWATWCGPCRRELPAFERIHKTYAQEKVKVLLVSLDFPSNLEYTLYAFLKTNQITAPVVLLNEPDANAWIDKVDPSWTGSLPATLMYQGITRRFQEKELSYQDIVDSIHSFINL
jgi:thiol-disulfide isomerase/thioredoxin